MTSTEVATVPARSGKSLINTMADAEGMDAGIYMATIKATCFPTGRNDSPPTNEEFAAFLMVAHRYQLNPILKEIHAFKSNGKIGTIVGVDGWSRLINNHGQFDGMEFCYDEDENGELLSVTCRMYRKDRSKPIEATEFMAECYRPTEPWKRWPRRMLRHKTMIQAARYAFGFTGIVDEDEFDRRKDPAPAQAPSRTGVEQRFLQTDAPPRRRGVHQRRGRFPSTAGLGRTNPRSGQAACECVEPHRPRCPRSGNPIHRSLDRCRTRGARRLQ